MEKILKMAVLYRAGSDPHDKGSEWRQIVLRSDRFPPFSTSFLIEEYFGRGKGKKKPSRATLYSGTNLQAVAREFEQILERFTGEGFKEYDPMTSGS